MGNREEAVRQRDGASDRRWVVVADDGSISTLGRASDPAEDELARVEATLLQLGRGAWLAVQSHSFHRAPPQPNFVAVRRLGTQGSSFEDAIAAARKREAAR